MDEGAVGAKSAMLGFHTTDAVQGDAHLPFLEVATHQVYFGEGDRIVVGVVKANGSQRLDGAAVFLVDVTAVDFDAALFEPAALEGDAGALRHGDHGGQRLGTTCRLHVELDVAECDFAVLDREAGPGSFPSRVLHADG